MRIDRPTEPSRLAALHAMRCAVLCVLIGFVLAGCKSSPPPEQDMAIPLPGFADEGPNRPKGVYAVIRRADIPLDESSDEAWSIVNERVVPPMLRGAWRGNGFRIGLLPRDRLDRYSEVMPKPVGFSRILMNKSDYPVAVLETPRLRSGLRFEMDLTRLPRPKQVEMVKGGDGSTLRLLAKIEADADGGHTLVLTPQHHIPSPLTLIPRGVLEKEMDGRVYDELTLRIALDKEQIAVVGLHWPWPMVEALDADESGGASLSDGGSFAGTTPVIAIDPKDPTAPPRHLTATDIETPGDAPTDRASGASDRGGDDALTPRYERAAPPMVTSFGSTLLTGTRIRQPVRSVLLITIEEPVEELLALPEE